jgi:hypothetical protein
MAHGNVVYNLYEIWVGEPETDIISEFCVAAPSIRKAVATVIASVIEANSRAMSFRLLEKDIDPFEQDSYILVWEESHGFITNMHIDIPTKPYHIGMGTLKEDAIEVYEDKPAIEPGGPYEDDEPEVQLPVIEDDLVD